MVLAVFGSRDLRADCTSDCQPDVHAERWEGEQTTRLVLGLPAFGEDGIVIMMQWALMAASWNSSSYSSDGIATPQFYSAPLPACTW